jgi:uncharacterized protein (DUF2252 family)
VDASSGFFHEHTISEGKRYRLKNQVFSLIRASIPCLGSSRPRSYLRKPPSLNPDRIRYFVKQYLQDTYQKITTADRCLYLLASSGNQHSQSKNFLFNAIEKIAKGDVTLLNIVTNYYTFSPTVKVG